MKLTSNFALLDVKQGRKTLRKVVGRHTHKVPVTVQAFIVGEWSDDDGVSIEYELDVQSVTLGKPIARICKCVRCEAQRAECGKQT
jgi:hypothetical protein